MGHHPSEPLGPLITNCLPLNSFFQAKTSKDPTVFSLLSNPTSNETERHNPFLKETAMTREALKPSKKNLAENNSNKIRGGGKNQELGKESSNRSLHISTLRTKSHKDTLQIKLKIGSLDLREKKGTSRGRGGERRGRKESEG